MKEVRPENSGRGIWYLNCLFASYVLDSKGFSNSFAFCSRGAVAPGLPCHRQSLRDKPVTLFSVYILTHPPGPPTHPPRPVARPIMGFCHNFHAVSQSSYEGTMSKRKVGRKRKYATRGSRARVRKHRASVVPKGDSAVAWNRYLEVIGLGMDRGATMSDAPHNGLGLLVTGGIDFSRIGTL